MQLHQLVDKCIEWVALDGVLGMSDFCACRAVRTLVLVNNKYPQLGYGGGGPARVNIANVSQVV
jgi:hypothetical protein